MTKHHNGNEEQLEREIEKELAEAQKETELDERIDQLAADLEDQFDYYDPGQDFCGKCGQRVTICLCIPDD